jgi:hypothetical protein
MRGLPPMVRIDYGEATDDCQARSLTEEKRECQVTTTGDTLA